MTHAAPPPPPPVLPPQPPPLARALALDLVTRFHLRLTDPRDSRLGGLRDRYELGAAGWTGSVATFVGFYTPSPDPRVAGPDLAARCAEAARWAEERLRLQGAERADVLIVALEPIQGSITAPALHPAVRVGAAAVDPVSADVQALLPIPRTLPGVPDIRARARALVQGAEAPTLAAVDLAERQSVAGGYAAPARQQLATRPIATYALIASFVAVFIVEKLLISSQASSLGLFDMGALGYGVPLDWWRLVSSAFLHDPGSGGSPFGTLPAHLLFNSLAMFWVGRLVEQLYGRLVLVAAFLVSAVGGGLLWLGYESLTNQPAGLTIGASAGITGLLGLLLMLGRIQGRNVPVGVAHAMQRYAVTYGAMILVFGFLIADVNNVAHIGGIVTGAAIGAVAPPLRRIGGRELHMWERIAIYVVFAVAAVALLVAVVHVAGNLSTSPGFTTGPALPGGG
ncbi:MAG: rhomboid family intramembrane serine protease [Candidatus Dormibacteria bacterium]